MSNTNSFTHFHSLAPELRLQIWEKALSERSVWAAIPNYNADRNVSVGLLPFKMVYIGPAPYLAGSSSREARSLMEKLYIKPISWPSTVSATSARSFWVNMDETVICIGTSCDPTAVLNSFAADELARFKHLAFTSSQFSKMTRICQLLAMKCPNLITVIVHCRDADAVNQLQNQTLTLETAAYYANIPGYQGPEPRSETLDVAYFRSLLLQHFADPPPSLHLLFSGTTGYLS